MSDDEAPKKPASAGTPAWVMTFADLMSLLMCFFVLLLSFSEMDVSKYKQIAGSMKEAFGVQRKHSVKEPPKGINIIATEFSAGRPNPTPFNIVEQMTTDEMKMFLDTGERRRKAGDGGKQGSGDGDAGSEQKQGAPELGKRRSKAGEDAGGSDGQAQKDGGKPDAGQDEQLVLMPKEDALRALKAQQEAEREERLQQTAKRVRSALRWEIKDGAVDVETEEQKIVIRIREKASFASGQADLRESFRPILKRVGQILKETEGQIIVSGHTDNLPIYTDRFRSNWELSAARAVSVVHDLVDLAGVPAERFAIEGLAAMRPVVPNNSWENRAKNRRVEIKLVQGEDLEARGELSSESAGPAPEQAAPAAEQPAGEAPPAPSAVEPAPAQPSKPEESDPFVINAG